MLTIQCAYCKTKLFRYEKIGQGKVLRCHKERIQKVFHPPEKKGEDVLCPGCKKPFAQDKGSYYQMIRQGFTYTGTKIRR